jgi:hypothetical protein
MRCLCLPARKDPDFSIARLPRSRHPTETSEELRSDENVDALLALFGRTRQVLVGT